MMYALCTEYVETGHAVSVLHTHADEARHRLMQAGFLRLEAEKRWLRIRKKRGRGVRGKIARAAIDMFGHFLETEEKNGRESLRAAYVFSLLCAAAEITIHDAIWLFDEMRRRRRLRRV